MAFTATLVYAGHDRLRYFIEATDIVAPASVDIESDGGPTPDLQTDSLAGPIKEISRVKAQGYGVIPVGGITSQAQARGLLLSDLNGIAVPFGLKMVTLVARIVPITGTPHSWTIDAVQGPSDVATPGLRITQTTLAAATCYLDLEVQGSIGA